MGRRGGGGEEEKCAEGRRCQPHYQGREVTFFLFLFGGDDNNEETYLAGRLWIRIRSNYLVIYE